MCHCPDRAPAGLRLHCDITITIITGPIIIITIIINIITIAIIIIIITIIILVIGWCGSPVPGLGSLVHRAAPGS